MAILFPPQSVSISSHLLLAPVSSRCCSDTSLANRSAHLQSMAKLVIHHPVLLPGFITLGRNATNKIIEYCYHALQNTSNVVTSCMWNMLVLFRQTTHVMLGWSRIAGVHNITRSRLISSFLPLEKMAAILQTIIFRCICVNENFVFLLKFY